MKNKAVLGILLALSLITSTVFGNISETSRQGQTPISAVSQPAPTHENADPRRGLSLALLEIMADSLFGFEGGNNLWVYVYNNPVLFLDPFGLVWDTASQILRNNPLYSDIADELDGYIEEDDAGSIFSFAKRFRANPCYNANDKKVVYSELIRDKLMWDHLANKHGFTKKIPANKSPFFSHGQPVYQKGTRYLSPDVDSHSGGYWKLYDNKGRRLGTYDEDMAYVGP